MMNGCYAFFNSEKNINHFYLNQFQNKIFENYTKHPRRKISDIHTENHNNYLMTQNNQNYQEYIRTPILHKRISSFSTYNSQKDKDAPEIIISDLDLNDKKNRLISVDDKIKHEATIKSCKNVSFKAKINKIKKVKFKKRFVSIIKVESYKKYNAELLNLRNYDDKTRFNCTCIIA